MKNLKYLRYIQYLFIAISIVTVVYLFAAPDEEAGVSLMLRWAYILLGLTVVVTLLFPIVNLVSNPRGAMRSLIGLAVVLVVLGVCYALSSAEPLLLSDNTVMENASTLKLSDTGLYAAYIALGATILISIGGEIRNAFK